MNRKLAGWVAAVSFGAVVGCNAGEGAEGASSAPATEVLAPLTYPETGHPVVARTADPVALANETVLEDLVNDYRVRMGLPPLEVLPEAKDLARGHSVHMGVHHPGFFDHCNPEGDLPANRAETAGLRFVSIGENLAAGQATPSEVFAAWLQSPAHKAVLDDPRWTHMGIGEAFDPGSPYGTYWTLSVLERSSVTGSGWSRMD